MRSARFFAEHDRARNSHRGVTRAGQNQAMTGRRKVNPSTASFSIAVGDTGLLPRTIVLNNRAGHHGYCAIASNSSILCATLSPNR